MLYAMQNDQPLHSSMTSTQHAEKQTVERTCAASTRWLALLDSVKESLPGTGGRLRASAIRSCSVRAQCRAASAPPVQPLDSASQKKLDHCRLCSPTAKNLWPKGQHEQGLGKYAAVRTHISKHLFSEGCAGQHD